jgi:hypothetical protein
LLRQTGAYQQTRGDPMLLRCHQCGREISRDSGVQRSIKTGSFTKGDNYFRTVNLCNRCNELVTAGEQTYKKRRSTIIVLVVAAVGVAVYLLYFRFRR